jgi:hypothetical protein
MLVIFLYGIPIDKILDPPLLKRQMNRNNGNIFGLFMFWKEEIRTRTIKKAKHEYTKDRQNMICR